MSAAVSGVPFHVNAWNADADCVLGMLAEPACIPAAIALAASTALGTVLRSTATYCAKPAPAAIVSSEKTFVNVCIDVSFAHYDRCGLKEEPIGCQQVVKNAEACFLAEKGRPGLP